MKRLSIREKAIVEAFVKAQPGPIIVDKKMYDLISRHPDFKGVTDEKIN